MCVLVCYALDPYFLISSTFTYKCSRNDCGSRCGVSAQQNQKMLKILFVELLRNIVVCINHIHKYFVSTNAVETIAGEDVVAAAQQKIKNSDFFAELLRCIVDHINHIHMYFVSTNAVKTIARVGVEYTPSKNEKRRIFYFC